MDSSIGKISIEKPVDELWDKLQTTHLHREGPALVPDPAAGGGARPDHGHRFHADGPARPAGQAPHPRRRASAQRHRATAATGPDARPSSTLPTSSWRARCTTRRPTSCWRKGSTGKTIGKGWKRVKIESIVARPAGMGKILLGVTISGAANGTVYVVGTPKLRLGDEADHGARPRLRREIPAATWRRPPAGSSMARCWTRCASEAKLPVEELLTRWCRS